MAAKKEETKNLSPIAGDGDQVGQSTQSLDGKDLSTKAKSEVQPPPIALTMDAVMKVVRSMGFVSKDALAPMIAQAVDAHVRGLNLEATLAPLQALLEDAQTQQAKPEGIHAVLVASMFNCPACNMRLDGPSGTSVQGKGVDYSHPFGESPKLNGGRCEYQGRKFKTPTIFLELQPKPQPKTQPLTAVTE